MDTDKTRIICLILVDAQMRTARGNILDIKGLPDRYMIGLNLALNLLFYKQKQYL